MKNVISNAPCTALVFGVACALLALAPADASSQTTCDLVLGLAVLADPGEVIDHKTDVSDGDCTTQMTVKVDKGDPVVTKVDFKIDRSCNSIGQAEITVISLEIFGSPPTISCNSDYDNPEDQTEVLETTSIADVPQLQELLLDAADATAMQFPSGNPTADLLVAKLTGAVAMCPCWTLADLNTFTQPDPSCFADLGPIPGLGVDSTLASLAGAPGEGATVKQFSTSSTGFFCRFGEPAKGGKQFLGLDVPEIEGCVALVDSACKAQ